MKPAHLERLRVARAEADSARRAYLLALLEARAAGATLQAIGDELGSTRQNVRQTLMVARKTLGNGGN